MNDLLFYNPECSQRNKDEQGASKTPDMSEMLARCRPPLKNESTNGMWKTNEYNEVYEHSTKVIQELVHTRPICKRATAPAPWKRIKLRLTAKWAKNLQENKEGIY